jgi:hypothetical protein
MTEAKIDAPFRSTRVPPVSGDLGTGETPALRNHLVPALPWRLGLLASWRDMLLAGHLQSRRGPSKDRVFCSRCCSRWKKISE